MKEELKCWILTQCWVYQIPSFTTTPLCEVMQSNIWMNEKQTKKKPTQYQNSKPAPFKADPRHGHTLWPSSFLFPILFIYSLPKNKEYNYKQRTGFHIHVHSDQGNPGSYFTDGQHCLLLMPLQLLCNWNYLKHWNEKGWEKKHMQQMTATQLLYLVFAQDKFSSFQISNLIAYLKPFWIHS